MFGALLQFEGAFASRAKKSNKLGRRRLNIEPLESRNLLSAAPLGYATPNYLSVNTMAGITPMAGAAPSGYTPQQVRHAYGFDQVTFGNGIVGDGTGTTIAIVDAYDNPNIASDLQKFNAAFGLPNTGFTKVNQTGGTKMPAANKSWATEIALDVQWAHAIAPGANILLVEAKSNSMADLMTAVNYARNYPGVVAVSMSWGGAEYSGQTSYDSYFTTPAGHTGVSFFVASGDSGAPAGYPDASPNVVSVGGTGLYLSGGNYSSESGWSGSGGGISKYEAQPAYQKGIVTQSTTKRATPDVAYNSNPSTGFPVYDSFNNGTAKPWGQWGGTSAAAPQWAALVAIADQGRALAGLGSLDSRTQLLPALYKLPASDFHDITTGTSTGSPNYTAAAGYDLVTGRGTPIANLVIRDLVTPASTAATHFSVSATSSAVADTPFSITVSALDASNNVSTGYVGTVHFTSSDLGSGVVLPQDYKFTAADKGVHTFTGVTLATVGPQSVTAKDTVTGTIAGSANVNVTALPTHFAINAISNPTAGTPFSITVSALDASDNPVTTYLGSVHLTSSDLGSGVVLPQDYTFTSTDKGVHTFTSGVVLVTAGPQTVSVKDKSNSNLTGTASVTVAPSITHFSLVASNNATAGAPFSITVSALDGSDNPFTTYLGKIHFTSSDVKAEVVLPADYTFTAADNGVHTFTYTGDPLTGVTLVTAGVQTVAVKDTVKSNVAGTASVSVAAAAASQLVFGQQPTNVVVGASINPAVTVRLLDAYNNLVVSDNTDQVSLTIGNNPAGGVLAGSTTAIVSGGVATFGNLSIDKAGTGYKFAASSVSTSIDSNAFNVTNPQATNTIEGFETGNLSAYKVLGGKATSASVSAAAAHDGAYGLSDTNGNDWVYRTDAAVQMKAGDTVSIWLRFTGTPNGRAYFGFGASAAGTLALVAAPNTNQLLLQKVNFTTNASSGGAFKQFAAVSQTWQANQWYRLEVNWSTSGQIIGKVFASDGVTLLKSVQAVQPTGSPAIISGGIAFRAFGTSVKSWDSVQLTPGVNSFARLVTAPATSTSTRVASGASGGTATTSQASSGAPPVYSQFVTAHLPTSVPTTNRLSGGASSKPLSAGAIDALFASDARHWRL